MFTIWFQKRDGQEYFMEKMLNHPARHTDTPESYKARVENFPALCRLIGDDGIVIYSTNEEDIGKRTENGSTID